MFLDICYKFHFNIFIFNTFYNFTFGKSSVDTFIFRFEMESSVVKYAECVLLFASYFVWINDKYYKL